MTEGKERKAYCDAEDQKKVIDRMTACDENANSDKERKECYSKVIEEDGGCMSS